MMPTSVMITVDDNGQVSVGMHMAGEENMGMEGMAEGKEDQMQPVKSVDEALQVAKDMLTGQTGAQAQEAEQVATGYNRMKGGGMQEQAQKMLGGM